MLLKNVVKLFHPQICCHISYSPFFYVSQNYSNYFQIYLAQKFHPPRLNNRNSISPDIIFQTFSPQFPSQYFTPFRSFKLQNNFFFSKTIFLLCCDINTYSTRTHTTILMHFADGFPPSPPLLSLSLPLSIVAQFPRSTVSSKADN